jgi:hypothetical protein
MNLHMFKRLGSVTTGLAVIIASSLVADYQTEALKYMPTYQPAISLAPVVYAHV